jgi:cation diffusion facilitator CzcD-associated flavoprotein CzcO
VTSSSLPRACVIGAGSSGIAALKALVERGVPADCFEKSDRVGGNWVFGNRNGVSSAYKTLHINTSRERMEYSDFPMPKSFPDFPHHTQIARYFDDYVEHFDLRRHVSFETEVSRVRRRSDGVWEVELDGGRETRLYDAVLVANGHHWDPRWPEPPFPGRFEGEEIHSHHYTDPETLRGRDVVVLGMGNSAMDIAVDASYVARNTYLAARRGAWIIPKYVRGRPIDQPWRHGRLSSLLAKPGVPWSVRRTLLQRTIEEHVGRPEEYGLPAPDHRPGEAHPTISGRILDRLAHGAIVPKPNIAELRGERVCFEDGSSVEADLIVYCTGYKVTFPFFDEDFISAPDNDLPLFRRVFHPEVDGVFFVALLQPLGATMPLAEAQGRWIADYLRGEYHLPARAEMLEDMRRERETMFKRYVKSKRHTMQIDYDDYMHQLAQERKAGGRRARDGGYSLPVAPRAAAAAAAVGAPATA